MPFDLSEVVFDPDLGQSFVLLRTPGAFGPGGWVPQNPPLQVPAFGVIAIASDKEMQMFPEGDRLTGSLFVASNTPIYVTSEALNMIADQVSWRGNMYKANSLGKWEDFSFYAALFVRETGS